MCASLVLLCEKCGGFTGGTHYHYYELAKALAELKHNVIVISAKDTDPYFKNSLSDLGIDYYTLNWNPYSLFSLSSIKEASKKLNEKIGMVKRKYDIEYVIAHQHLTALLETKYARPALLSTKFHGTVYDNALFLRQYICGFFGDPNFLEIFPEILSLYNASHLRIFERYAVAKSDILMYVSNYIKNRIHEICGYQKSSKCEHVVYNGVSELFLNSSKKKYDSGKNEFSILFFGNLTPSKGLFYLLREFAVFKKLVEKNKEKKITLRIAGHHRLYYSLTVNMIRKLKLGNSVTLLGRLTHEQLLSIFNHTDLVVVPSLLCESLGNAILQAMAFGLPVLASKNGGTPEIIKDKFNGFLFTPSRGSLAKAFCYAYHNPDVLMHIGYEARKTILTKFSNWKRVASETINVLKKGV